jgi:hypothetical protein
VSELRDLKQEFDALRIAESTRLRRYDDYRRETEEVRDIDLDLDIGDLDYGRRKASGQASRRHRIAIPFGQATTVKHAYRISGRLPDAIVDRREENPQERHRSDTMEKMWWSITRESDGDAQFASAAWDSSKLGAATFEAYWSVEKMMPLYRSIDPAGLLVVKGVENPHDFQRAYRFWDVPTISLRSEYRDQSFRGAPVNVNAISATTTVGNTEMTTVVEACSKTTKTRFVAGDTPVGLYELTHAYSFVPFVVIPNLGPERDVWGWADYEFIRGLARYIPILFSREADVLKAAAGGAYTEKKTGQPLTKVASVIADGGVLSIGRDGEVAPIAAPEMPNFEPEHAARALEMFKMVGFSPDASWGDGNAGSGSDRGLQLQPQLELTGLKQQNWAPGLSRLARMLFKMVDTKMPDGTKTRYTGMHRNAHRASPFNLTIGPGADSAQVANPSFDPNAAETPGGPDEMIDVPMTPRELFDGDYTVRFLWHNRINPDDPAFSTSEVNKFAQGVQSLRTTLERLGIQNPEDEMRLIEQEAERFPWLRNGMIQMIRDQLAAQENGATSQGAGGGAPPSSDQAAALATMGTKDGQALDLHAMTSALPGGVGTPSG